MAYEDLKVIKCFRFHKNKQHWGFIPVYFSNNRDTGGSAVICAYVKGKSAPLTEEEVQKILDFVK